MRSGAVGLGLRICSAFFAYSKIKVLMLPYIMRHMSIVIQKWGFSVITTAYVWIYIINCYTDKLCFTENKLSVVGGTL